MITGQQRIRNQTEKSFSFHYLGATAYVASTCTILHLNKPKNCVNEQTPKRYILPSEKIAIIESGALLEPLGSDGLNII